MPKGKIIKPLAKKEEYSIEKLIDLFKNERTIPRTKLTALGWNDHGLNYKIGKLIEKKIINKLLNPKDTRKVVYIYNQ